jgi:hypothetical protein
VHAASRPITQREPPTSSAGPKLVTRREAAAYLGYELRSFERNVQPFIPWIGKGRGMRTTEEELDRWVQTELERSRARLAAREERTRSPTPKRHAARPSVGGVVLSAEALAMSARLKSRRK